MAHPKAVDPLSSRAGAGFFSNSRNVRLPIGQRFSPGSLQGCYIDMRVKAATNEWPWAKADPPLYVAVTQWGLGSFERYLAGEGEQWLAGACVDGSG